MILILDDQLEIYVIYSVDPANKGESIKGDEGNVRET